MFKNRYDGRRIKSLEPFQMIMPYVMKTRTDSMNMYEDNVPCEIFDEYIKEKATQGIKLDYMQIFIAAIVRTIALRPKLNRFVMNGHIYARPKIWVSFAIHHDLSGNQDETTIKLCFEGTETILEIADKIQTAILKETASHTEANATDKLAKLLTRIPGPILRLAVNTLMWMDRHNIMPKAIIEASPFHTTFFITNLKSLSINHIFHHVYEFGTTGVFFAMGKERNIPLYKNGKFIPQKAMGFGLTTDERFCDGLYLARSLRLLKKLLRDPKALEQPLAEKVEDDR